MNAASRVIDVITLTVELIINVTFQSFYCYLQFIVFHFKMLNVCQH